MWSVLQQQEEFLQHNSALLQVKGSQQAKARIDSAAAAALAATYVRSAG